MSGPGLLQGFILVMTGFSGGMLVGTAFMALINTLHIPARLAALSYSRHHVRLYEYVLGLGAWAAAFWLPFPSPLWASPYVLAPVGLLMGVFVGMLASALAETIGVIPVLAHRTGLGTAIVRFVWAVAAGKILGSLAFWIFPGLTQ